MEPPRLGFQVVLRLRLVGVEGLAFRASAPRLAVPATGSCFWMLAAYQPGRSREEGQLRHRTFFKPIMTLLEG